MKKRLVAAFMILIAFTIGMRLFIPKSLIAEEYDSMNVLISYQDKTGASEEIKLDLEQISRVKDILDGVKIRKTIIDDVSFSPDYISLIAECSSSAGMKIYTFVINSSAGRTGDNYSIVNAPTVFEELKSVIGK